MRLRDLDLRQHLADPALKQRFVTPMFDLIAPRYDEFTRLFSYGMDRRWKRIVVAELGARAPRGARILDLACGTGDLAFAAAAAIPEAHVTGLDAAPRMIALARQRAAGGHGSDRAPASTRVRGRTPTFEIGDMDRLAYADQSADVMTAGYAFRNAPDYGVALREAARVLRPGGVLISLDFYRPESMIWRTLFLTYLRMAGNLVGWWWHREPLAYGYIASSVAAFVSAPRFNAALAAAGFDVACTRTFLLGGVCIHVAVRTPHA